MVVILLAVLAAPFPLPSVDGKALAVTEQQKSFRVPMRFEKVRAFYDEQLKTRPQVVARLTGVAGERVLTITNKDKADVWRSATVREREGETVIDVVPVLHMETTEIEGQAGPLVQFVIGRSPDVEKAVNSIDHTEQIRR